MLMLDVGKLHGNLVSHGGYSCWLLDRYSCWLLDTVGARCGGAEMDVHDWAAEVLL